MSERSGYMSPEILGCQFSIYPLRQTEIGGPIEAAIQAALAEGCTVRVGNLSTLMSGSEDQVFAALRAAFRAAQLHGPAVMTVALAAGMPTDELVGEIQREVEADAPAGRSASQSAAGDSTSAADPDVSGPGAVPSAWQTL